MESLGKKNLIDYNLKYKMNNIIYITCIGIDEKLHECEPHKNTCKCGVVVKNKKISLYDYFKRYSCYECKF
jgi:hypothetical protein